MQNSLVNSENNMQNWKAVKKNHMSYHDMMTAQILDISLISQ